jgi:hypothetical protein
MLMSYSKRVLGLSLFLYLALFGIDSPKANALITKEQAIEFVIDSIIRPDSLGPDSLRICVYINPDSLPEDTSVISFYHSYSNPYPWSWFFFVDDFCGAGFGHQCRYVFLENGVYYAVTHEFYPPDIENSLELVFPRGVEESRDVSPTSKSLRILPNPFAQYTRINYQLSNRSYVSLKIYDISGRLLKTLINTEQEPGHHYLHWDGRDDEGARIPPGAYACKLVSNGTTTTKLVMLY